MALFDMADPRARSSSLTLPVNQPRFVEKAYTRGADAMLGEGRQVGVVVEHNRDAQPLTQYLCDGHVGKIQVRSHPDAARTTVDHRWQAHAHRDDLLVRRAAQLVDDGCDRSHRGVARDRCGQGRRRPQRTVTGQHHACDLRASDINSDDQ